MFLFKSLKQTEHGPLLSLLHCITPSVQDMFVALGMIESSEVGEMKPYGTIDFHKEGNVDHF